MAKTKQKIIGASESIVLVGRDELTTLIIDCVQACLKFYKPEPQIEVLFIFENAYCIDGRYSIEEKKCFLPALPRKGDMVDFTDYLFTKDDNQVIGPGYFVVEEVTFDYTEKGKFKEIIISLIPFR